MRLDVLLMGGASGILSYEEEMKDKRPIYWKNVVQYFAKKQKNKKTTICFDRQSIGLIG